LAVVFGSTEAEAKVELTTNKMFAAHILQFIIRFMVFCRVFCFMFGLSK
jgi:hypothetical protein